MTAPTMASEFTAEEWSAVDAGAVRAYIKRETVLPAWLKGGGEGPGLDPASEVRGIAYMWAMRAPQEVHERAAEPWKIAHQTYLRVGEIVDRARAAKAPEVTAEYLDEDGNVTSRWTDVSDPEKRGIPPRRYLPTYRRWDERSPLYSDRVCTLLDTLGRIPAPDQMALAVSCRTPGEVAALHTRPPTAEEYWNGVFDGNGRRSVRAEIAADTGLAAETISAVAEKVAPRVQTRFRTEYQRATDPGPTRQRITREETSAALNADYAVFLDEDWNTGNE